MTSICAAGFFITSLTLGVLATQSSKEASGLLENVNPAEIQSTAPEDDISAPVGGISYTSPEGVQFNQPVDLNKVVEDVAEQMDIQEKTLETVTDTVTETPQDQASEIKQNLGDAIKKIETDAKNVIESKPITEAPSAPIE